MVKKKTAKSVKKKTIKKKSSSKSNIVKIQVEAKAPRKRAAIKKTAKPRVSIEKVQIEMQPILIQNFAALQKAMMNLAEKVSNVNDKMNSLLTIFEDSAKSLAKRDFKLAGETSPELMKKIDNLSEQNKIIAKGLTLLHEPSPARIAPPMPAPAPIPKPVAPAIIPQRTPAPQEKTIEGEEYKKSTSFKPLKPKPTG